MLINSSYKLYAMQRKSRYIFYQLTKQGYLLTHLLTKSVKLIIEP